MPGTANQATALVIINGQQYVPEKLEVCMGKKKNADTFKACFALTASPGLDTVSGTTTATCLINGAQIGGMFNVEHVTIDFDGTSVEVTGRDQASAKLIDTQNTQTFTNQPPESVIQSLAQGVGTSIDSASGKAGKIYNQDWNAITHRIPAWDAICNIADQYGMNCFITGSTLYVKDVDTQWPPINITYSPPSASGSAQGNFLKLKCSRNFQMSKKVHSKKQSFDYKSKKTLTADDEAGGSSDGDIFYTHTHAKNTKDQLQTRATKTAKENAKHAFNIDVEIPGDTSVTALFSLQLTGTGTSFDGSYDVDDVEHRIEWGGGYITCIKGKTAMAGGANASANKSTTKPVAQTPAAGGGGGSAPAAVTSAPSTPDPDPQPDTG